MYSYYIQTLTVILVIKANKIYFMAELFMSEFSIIFDKWRKTQN